MAKDNQKNEEQIVLFQQLVRSAYDPLRDMIEYGDLGDKLSPQDVAKICNAIEGGVNNWIRFLKLAKEADSQNK